MLGIIADSGGQEPFPHCTLTLLKVPSNPHIEAYYEQTPQVGRILLYETMAA
jgi:hypothetical protein